MRRIGDAPTVRRLLIGAALLLSALFLLLPLVAIFAQAFSQGVAVFWGEREQYVHSARHWSHADHRADDHPPSAWSSVSPWRGW